MISALLLLIGCSPPPPWTVPTRPEPVAGVAWKPDAIEVLDMWPEAQSLAVVDGELLAATGLGLQLGARSSITPGWAWDAEVDGDVIVVADGPSGVTLLDRTTLALRARHRVGNAVAVAGPWVLVGSGLWNHQTGARVALDGGRFTDVALEPDGRWWVSTADGAVFEGQGDHVIRRHPHAVRRLALGPDGLALLTTAQDLRTLSTVIDHGVADVVATGEALWWIRDDNVIRESTVVHQREGIAAQRLGVDGEAVLVAWSDGRIERVDDAGATLITTLAPAPPMPVPGETPGWSLGRDGVVHTDGTVVRLPEGARPDWYNVAPDGTLAAWQRARGLLTIRRTDSSELRFRAPAQINQVAWVPGYAILALSSRGVAALPLEAGPWPEAQILDFPPIFWTSVCGDGETVWLTAGTEGVVQLGMVRGQLAVLQRLQTPGDAAMCTLVDGQVEIYDTVARLRIPSEL